MASDRKEQESQRSKKKSGAQSKRSSRKLAEDQKSAEEIKADEMIKLRQLGGSIKGQVSNDKIKSKVSGSQKSQGPRENDDSAQFLSNRSSKKKSANKID